MKVTSDQNIEGQVRKNNIKARSASGSDPVARIIPNESSLFHRD